MFQILFNTRPLDTYCFQHEAPRMLILFNMTSLYAYSVQYRYEAPDAYLFNVRLLGAYSVIYEAP